MDHAKNRGRAALSCSALGIELGDPIVGSAAEDSSWLFVEHQGPWPAQALDEAPMAERTRAFLTGLSDTRVQLIRRTGSRREDAGAIVFRATLGADGATVERARLESLDDLAGPADLDRAGFEPWTEPLWFVCTHGRRDRCCAVKGRAVAAAIAAEWPEETWETTHLGGHRWAGTLLALPSGLMLGRLTREAAPEAVALLARGHLRMEHLRGRAGVRRAVQSAEAEVLARQDLPDWRGVRVESATDTHAVVRSGSERFTVALREGPMPVGPASCRDLETA